jgi:ABC-type antimicrobial peptide transport system permease subunit
MRDFMINNYLKIAVRNLKTHKFYSVINVFGLAMGLTVCILILLWVQDELSYDRFHQNAHQIYRVVFADESYDNIRHYSMTPPALSAALKKDYPEVVYSVTYYSRNSILLKNNKKVFKETIGFASASIFNIFSIPFVSGDPETAFKNPFSIVISEKMAKKYFGDEDPIAKTITMDSKIDFIVSGIIKDLPENSFLQLSALTHFDHLYTLSGRGKSDSWDSFGYNTFVLLASETNRMDFNLKISDYAIEKHSYSTFKPRLYLQPLLDIHLYNLNGGGIITYIYIFSFMAIFILLIACMNFMNLVTARSAIRTKEISLRKVIGARRKNLIYQFLGESILMSLISLFISLIFIERLIPIFNDLTGKNLSLDAVGNSFVIPILICITVLTGILAGSYPAFFLSAFKPVTILRGSNISSSSPLRKFLVVFQFSLSVIMIISTMVISNQLDYIKDQNLGFNKDHIVYIPLNQELRLKTTSLKNKLEQHSQIQNVTATSNKIGISRFHSIDLNQWEGNTEEKSILIGLIYTDYDFLNTFDIKITAGRYYSTDFASDSLGVVLNEAAIEEMGLTDPIGKKIFEKSHIIGVVRDFNYQSLHSSIGPLAVGMNPIWNRYLAVKIRPDNIGETLKYIETVVTGFAPEFPYEYHFLDQEFEKLYHSEGRLGKMFLYFSVLAVLISALGLFGLASFLAGQRTKEIGVRKVLGASIPGILLLLSKEFVKWVVLANFIAWPVSWYVMNLWLENFAYRTTIHWWIFILAGSIALMIALITVSSQALKAALSNPIDALRYE